MTDVQRYLCGCIVYDGGHPSACPLHGRIIASSPEKEVNPTYAVWLTPDEVVALGHWLERQTFPYDEPLVHAGAGRMMKQARIWRAQ